MPQKKKATSMTTLFSEEILSDEDLLVFQVEQLKKFLNEIGLSDKQIEDNLIYSTTKSRRNKMENKIFKKLSSERISLDH